MEKGWYNDPYGRYLRRYYDGVSWTNQVQSAAGEVLTESSPGLADPPESGSAEPSSPPPSMTAPSQGKSKKKMWVSIGVGVLVIAAIGATADDSSGNSEESSASDVTTTSEITDDVLDSSTGTGNDSNASTEASSDSASTSESSAASSSDPQVALDYISDIMKVNDDGVEYMEQFSDLMFRSDTFSEEWQLDVAIVLVLLSGQYDRVKNIEAPACFEDVHSHMLEANRLLVVMSETFAEGVDTFDTAKIEQATELLYQSADETVKATDLLNNFDPSECI